MNSAVLCKVCGSQASLFGSVDFSKSCEEARGLVLPPTGHMIKYSRCPTCGLLFTTDFDDWSRERFQSEIYNADYAIVDPDFEVVRPTIHARMIKNELGGQAEQLSIVDYGGGNGRFAAELRNSGFPRCETYDPLQPEYSDRPLGRFNFITCFETMEHVPDPQATVADIVSLLDDGGIVFFSTFLQPWDIEQQGLSWWYVGPRNGHITLYSGQALARLWGNVGLRCVSFNENYHAAFGQVPAFASQLLRKAARILTADE